MLETRLLLLERGDEREDGRILLVRVDAPGGERPAVAEALDTELDRLGDIAGAEEVPVQGVDEPVGRQGRGGGDDALSENLSAEDPPIGLVLAGADEEVGFPRPGIGVEPTLPQEFVQACDVRLGRCRLGIAHMGLHGQGRVTTPDPIADIARRSKMASWTHAQRHHESPSRRLHQGPPRTEMG